MTLLTHPVCCQSADSTEYNCHLTAEDKAALVDGRRWNVTDVDIEEHGLQGIVNCTIKGDMLFLLTSQTIRPESRIVIPRGLTIGGMDSNDAKPRITCPVDDGLFLVGHVSVTFMNLRIEGCKLGKEHRVSAIIITTTCSWTSEAKDIQLIGVDFVQNTNLGGSIGLAVKRPWCHRVAMRDIHLRDNRYTNSFELARLNDLRDIWVIGNVLQEGVREKPLFHFPSSSESTVRNFVSENNTGSVLHVESGVIDIRDSVFVGNVGYKMGVMVASSSQVFVWNSIFDSNTCEETGGAISLFDCSNADFEFSQFLNNFAPRGGALYSIFPHSILMNSCIFAENAAKSGHWNIGGGGAVHITNGTESSFSEQSLHISNCTFHKNKAVDCIGGAIFVRYWDDVRIDINGSNFVSNHVESGTASGGAIHADISRDVIVTVSDSAFHSNLAGSGGALSVNVVGEFLFVRCHFLANEAIGSNAAGGAIDFGFFYGAVEATFRDVLFEDNDAHEGRGGAVVGTWRNGSLHLINSRFLRNKAGDGGAVRFGYHPKQPVKNCTCEENTAEETGGAGHFSMLSIEKCTFEENTAEEKGGALYLFGRSRSEETSYSDVVFLAEIENHSLFVNNTARSGGAIFTEMTTRILHSRFEENKAEKAGGAVAVGKNVTLCVISNASFIKNRATVGGALSLERLSSLKIYEDTILQDNVATMYGGAMYIQLTGKLVYLFLSGSVVSGNRATVGGGGFFQIVADQQVVFNETIFENNHAERGGGACFINKIGSLVFMQDCTRDVDESPAAFRGQISSNFNCSWMKRNSVGDGGYGKDVATVAERFAVHVVYRNGTTDFVLSGASYQMPLWMSGRGFPVFVIVMLDHFLQAGALTESTDQNQILSAQVKFDGYTKATVASFDGLIPNAMVTNVSSGTGNLSVGAPFQIPNDYSLVMWIEDEMSSAITVNVTLRECMINEESKLGNTLCERCDSNHFNLDPEDSECEPCPLNSNCSSWGLMPKKNHWIPSPCYPKKAIECLSEEACDYDGREESLIEFYDNMEPTCQFNESTLLQFNRLQCNEKYEGLLCGSCSTGHGQFKLGCFECESLGVTIMYLLGMTAWILFATYVGVLGNLTDILLPRTTVPISVPSTDGGDESAPLIETDDDACEIAKRNVTESVKLFLNFSQVCSLALTINSRWTGLMDASLRALNFVGAVSVEATISLDCLFSDSSSIPRSISRVILSILLPFAALTVGAAYWRMVISRDFPVLKRRLVLTTVVVFYISYIGWVQNLSAALNCVTIPSETIGESSSRYWTEDTAVECFTGTPHSSVHWSRQ